MLVTLYRLVLPNGYIEFREYQDAVDWAASLGINNPTILSLPRDVDPD